MDLDVTLALAELTQAKSDLSSSLGSYKEGSDEYKKLSDLLNFSSPQLLTENVKFFSKIYQPQLSW